MTVEHETYNDVRDRLVRLPHGDPYGGCSYCRDDLFTVRHRLIRELDPAPRSVFEFGALYGYFLVTAIDACGPIEGGGIRKVGWVDNESHTPGSNEMCLANIADRCGQVFANARTQYWTSLGEMHDDIGHFDDITYDLVAVDSDHTTEGCLADLRAAHALNPMTIMVDDWTAGSHGDDIHAAVQTFLDETAVEYGLAPAYVYEVDEYVTVNGLAVLTRKDWRP